jgi:hypothetical protein
MPKGPKKLLLKKLDIINTFSKGEGNGGDGKRGQSREWEGRGFTRVSSLSIYFNNEQTDKKYMKTIPFIMASKN